jgi:hypothetical protein
MSCTVTPASTYANFELTQYHTAVIILSLLVKTIQTNEIVCLKNTKNKINATNNIGVGIATCYEQGGWSSIPGKLQTGSEAQPTSYPMRTGGSFPIGKAAGP